MIDTDKYEGHTEGPWWINHEDGDGATSIWNGTLDEGDMNHVADVDAHDNDLRLISDAPLLLAEVKRMRAVFDSHGECHLCGFRLDEHYPDHELPCDHVEEGLE